jgi:hypothetical protein
MKTVTLCLFCILIYACVQAIDRPVVTVNFKISETKFTNHYGTRISQLEARLTDSLTALLRRNIPFFNFQSSKPASDTLYFNIVREEDSAARQFFNIYLQLTFSGKNVKPACQPLSWNFAPNGTYYAFIRSDGEFVLEVLKKIKELYNQNGSQIVSRLLCNRLVTEHLSEIGIDFSKRQWNLPFTYGDLEVGLDSKFKIVQQHNEQNQVVRKYHAEVKGVPARNSRVMIEGLPGGQFDGETFDDLGTLKKSTYRGLIGIYIIQLRQFYEVSIVRPEDSGIQ